MLAPWLTALIFAVAKPTPPPHEAMVAAYERGETGRAVRLAARVAEDAASSPEALRAAALVRLFGAVRRNDHATVIAELQQAASHGADLGDYATVLAINARMGLRDCASADAKAQSIADDSPFAAAGWSRVAACWLRAKDVPQADTAAAKARSLARNDGQIAEIEVTRAPRPGPR